MISLIKKKSSCFVDTLLRRKDFTPHPLLGSCLRPLQQKTDLQEEVHKNLPHLGLFEMRFFRNGAQRSREGLGTCNLSSMGRRGGKTSA
jgi:hypothetical protein